MKYSVHENKTKKELRKGSLGELLVYQVSSLNGFFFWPFFFHFVEDKKKKTSEISKSVDFKMCMTLQTVRNPHKTKAPYLLVSVYHYTQQMRPQLLAAVEDLQCDSTIIRNQSSI